jgi:DNA polymerase-3 subunit epsilon
VLDFETTGLSPEWGDRATEVAAVVIEDGRIVSQYQSLMNAGVRIPTYIQELTGITDKMVKQAPPVNQVLRELAKFIGAKPLIAHNASFDRKFLDAELDRIRMKRKQDVMCSMRVARRVYPDAINYKLLTLVEYAGVPAKGRHHRALVDAQMAANLWLKMQGELKIRFRMSSVPLDLMQRLQSIPKHSLESFVLRYKKNGSSR